MDPVDYVTDEEEEESSDDKDGEEEHLAPADSTLSIPDSVPSSKEIELFETDESASTPPSPYTAVSLSMTRLRKVRKTVRPQTPLSSFIETQIVEYAFAPTPPLPPPSPLTPLSSPLLLIPSPPFPLPSPDHKGALPEDDMPPRKRICFTTSSRRFEIGESSEAATARQTGPALVREEVNEGITDLAATHRYDSEEFYTRHQDAHDDRALLQARISTLERERSQAMEAQIRELHVELERIRDAERHDRPADGGSSCVADALADYEANRGSGNGHDSHGSGSGSGRTPNTTRVRTYKDFLNCQPLNFKGTEGVELALMYGRMLPEESDQVEKYAGGLPDMIQGSVMASKPKMMQEAIEFANDLMDQKIHSFAERQSENKRKLDNNLRNNQAQQQPFKRQNVARAYIAGPSEKKEYGGTLPLCTKCNYHHNGSCATKCTNCKRIGHLARDCRILAAANTQRAPGEVQRVVTCFECGIQGHYKKDCPKLKNKNRGNQARNGEAHTRAYALGGNKVNLDSNVITGTFLLNNRYASVLFDTCANRSFVSTTFSSLIDIIPSTLDNSYDVDFDVIIGMDWLSLYHVVIVCDEKIIRGDRSNPGNES
ncbi:putative reverse transcriptase domain-containing protein [Tanacetum coccineum]